MCSSSLNFWWKQQQKTKNTIYRTEGLEVTLLMCGIFGSNKALQSSKRERCVAGKRAFLFTFHLVRQNHHLSLSLSASFHFSVAWRQEGEITILKIRKELKFLGFLCDQLRKKKKFGFLFPRRTAYHFCLT